MSLSLIEHTPRYRYYHADHTNSETIDLSWAVSGHDTINFINISAAARWTWSIEGTNAGASISGSPAVEGGVVPECTFAGIGGIRTVRYNNNQFSSLKLKATASGADIIVEVCRSGSLTQSS